MSECSSIEFQAAEWIERRTNGQPFDETAFGAWLARDPRHPPVFDEMWRHIMGADIDAALRAYTRRAASRGLLVTGGVAALLAVAGIHQVLPLIELRLAPSRHYAAADDTVRAVELSDGTQLSLAGGAEVTVRYTQYDRVVELTRGTIFLHVSHDAQRPLRVDTGNARIVDVGTSFEVLSQPGNVRVTVASGVVQFGRNGWLDTPIRLAANQAAHLDGTGLGRMADVMPGGVARWRGIWAEYKDAPLSRVIADLQTLSPIPIEIADRDLADKPVGGRIRLTDPVGQLQNLAIIHGFRVHRTDHALVISQH